MTKYTIEGNINFQEELYKLLDEESDNEDECCQITGLPLKDKYVTLECNHHFNYDAVYKEIYKQKYEFRTYEPHTLSKKDLQKFRDSNLDYFIKCPYCRNLQFTILPYYKELRLKEVYGINSLDKTLPNTVILHNHQTNKYSSGPYYGDSNYTFNKFGVTFKYGICCHLTETGYKGINNKCTYQYVANIPNTELAYCKYHYRGGLREYKKSEKNKIMAAKAAVYKEKQEKINEQKKLLEEKNAEREAKGLPPLKRLPTIKKKVENVVEQVQTIQQYVPDQEQIGCKAVLKSGPNKGKECGCKKIETNGLCKRHSPKDEINNELKVDKNVL
jgi:predicted transcriptional regulator